MLITTAEFVVVFAVVVVVVVAVVVSLKLDVSYRSWIEVVKANYLFKAQNFLNSFGKCNFFVFLSALLSLCVCMHDQEKVPFFPSILFFYSIMKLLRGRKNEMF